MKEHLTTIFVEVDHCDISEITPEIGLVFTANSHGRVDQRDIRVLRNLGRDVEM